MRRRRKTRYTWLPVLNGRTFGEEVADASFQDFILDVPINGDVVVGTIPLLTDTPQSIIADPGEGMGEVIGNEYLLKRIVGKCFCSYTWQNVTGGDVGVDVFENAAVICAAGFFVARADPANFTNIVAASEAQILYNPLSAQTVREPWIWRRTWMLGSGGFGPGLTEDLGVTIPNLSVIRGRGGWPITNAGYPGVQDGPHIDAKTARRIRQEERLWFSFAACLNDAGGTTQSTVPRVEVILDCRYLGALRKARNRSNFA